MGFGLRRHRGGDQKTIADITQAGTMADSLDQITAEHHANALGRLWQAIVDNTRGEGLFWIGEILLSELEKETGFKGPGDHTR
jgi:hypothetical protein